MFRVGGTSHFPGSPVPFWFVEPCRNGEPRLGAQGGGGFQMVFPRLVPSNWFNMFDYINVFCKGTMRNRHNPDMLLDFVLRVQREMDDMWHSCSECRCWDCDSTPCTGCTGTFGGPTLDESLKETFLDVWLVPLCVIRLCSSGCFKCFSCVQNFTDQRDVYYGWVKMLESEHFLHVNVEGWFMPGRLQICLICSYPLINLKPLHQITSKYRQ